jgi:hypothetical protein
VTLVCLKYTIFFHLNEKYSVKSLRFGNFRWNTLFSLIWGLIFSDLGLGAWGLGLGAWGLGLGAWGLGLGAWGLGHLESIRLSFIRVF